MLCSSCFSACRSSCVVLVFKSSGEPSDPLNYRIVSLPHFAMCQKQESTLNCLSISVRIFLSDKQHGLPFSRLTADVLTFITYFIYQALRKNGDTRDVASYVSKPLGILNGYGVSGRIFHLIQAYFKIVYREVLNVSLQILSQ